MGFTGRLRLVSIEFWVGINNQNGQIGLAIAPQLTKSTGINMFGVQDINGNYSFASGGTMTGTQTGFPADRAGCGSTLIYISYFPLVRTMRKAMSSKYTGDRSVRLAATCENDRSFTTLPVRVLIH